MFPFELRAAPKSQCEHPAGSCTRFRPLTVSANLRSFDLLFCSLSPYRGLGSNALTDLALGIFDTVSALVEL